MSALDERGISVVPLFDGRKHPEWTGYTGPEPLRAAAEWVRKRKAEGLEPRITGRYALLRGEAIVIDPEGKKWGDVPHLSDGEAVLPPWVGAVREAAMGMPSWTSAGGDGGVGLRNVLVALPYKKVCEDLDLPWGEGATHRVRLERGGQRGELLLRYGVCVPYSEVTVQKEGSTFRGTGRVEWYGPWADPEAWTWSDAEEASRKVWPDLCAILRDRLMELEAEGLQVDGLGEGSGEEPLVRSVARALFEDGFEGGWRATAEALSNGASRHYLVKTWANWAYTMWGGETWLAGDAGVDVLCEKIGTAWAYNAGFTRFDIGKAVRDERRYLGALVG